MDNELRDLLRSVACDGHGDTHSHISWYGPNAAWTIPLYSQNTFWMGYCDLVSKWMCGEGKESTHNPISDLCLAEKPTEIMPVITKFTFRFLSDPGDNDWEPYTDDFLLWLCHIYQSTLNEVCDMTSENGLEFICAVLESSDHWYEEDANKQRQIVMEIRLQFPYCRVDVGVQNRIIRPHVIQKLRNNGILSKLTHTPIGDWETIISPSIVNDPVTMYGSTEVSKRPKLKLTHIWELITDEMMENGILPADYDLDAAFEPTNHNVIHQRILEESIVDGYDLEHWIPMFLSLGYWNPVTCLKRTTTDTGRFTEQIRGQSGGSPTDIIGGDENLSDREMAEQLIPMLNSKRFLREPFWIDIGKALYVSSDGEENGLLAWITHTERILSGHDNIPQFMLISPTLQETARNLYYTFSNSTITVKTLAWYAREDSPVRYADWHKAWCRPSMEQALSAYHTDVGQALYRVYWLDFAYCSLGRGKWYHFHKHRWVEMSGGVTLRKVISGDFMRRFESSRVDLAQDIRESNNDVFKSNAELTMKKITALIGKLKTVSFKSSIMREAEESFINDRFMSLLDSNAEYTGLTNGVLEIVGNVAMFRSAKPEDFISMCAGVPYHEDYTWHHPLVQECMTWFSQVFPDTELRHHFLKFAASCLKGKNSDKIFPIFTGEGDNSKSMIVKLFETTFGSYCIKLDISNVTDKGGSASGPTPQLARAKSTRVAFMDEPEDDVPMKKGIIKKWIGGDSFFGRLLNDNGGDIVITFKVILTCNKVPIMPNPDKAIKNRTRLFPYLSTWVDNAPEDAEEQLKQRRFKKNPFFERRIPVLAPAFLWIMSQYYPYYIAEGIKKDPDIVTQTTESYWRDNDVYAQFTADNIQEVFNENGVRDRGARISLSEIYSEFKVWFRDSFPGSKVPERALVRSELSSRWGKMENGNAWYGIRIITNEGGPINLTDSLTGKKGTKNVKNTNNTNNSTDKNDNVKNDNIKDDIKNEVNVNTDKQNIVNTEIKTGEIIIDAQVKNVVQECVTIPETVLTMKNPHISQVII